MIGSQPRPYLFIEFQTGKPAQAYYEGKVEQIARPRKRWGSRHRVTDRHHLAGLHKENLGRQGETLFPQPAEDLPKVDPATPLG